MYDLLQKGKERRATGATEMNKNSSRSHCVFMIRVEICETGADNQEHIRYKMGSIHAPKNKKTKNKKNQFDAAFESSLCE